MPIIQDGNFKMVGGVEGGAGRCMLGRVGQRGWYDGEVAAGFCGGGTG